jgi:hypothetical protein
VIAKRVGSALALLDEASPASGAARQKLLAKVARQLTPCGAGYRGPRHGRRFRATAHRRWSA